MSDTSPDRLRVIAQSGERKATGWAYAIVYYDPPLVLVRSEPIYESERAATTAGTHEVERVRHAMRDGADGPG